MNYSDYTYIYYVGADAWGETAPELHPELNKKLEAAVSERFPGIEFDQTIDPYRTGVRGQDAAVVAEIEYAIGDITEKVLGDS